MCKGQQMQYRADNKIQNMMLIYYFVVGLVILIWSRFQENIKPPNKLIHMCRHQYVMIILQREQQVAMHDYLVRFRSIS